MSNDWGTAGDYRSPEDQAEWESKQGSLGMAIFCWVFSCFPYSTLVETPHCRTQIGNLSEGQTILSYGSDGALVVRTITRKLVYKPAALVRVAFESEEATLVCTASHSFLTDKGYQSLRKLRPGDFITRVTASKVVRSRIESIVPTGTVEPVFNLYTQGEHNFIADGCVAHNFTHFRMLRVALHRLFFDSAVLLKDDSVLALKV